jgi:2-polyprenyl-3-methyl-5-hydroxy-6-metoxy-1,4-benzoquinol methylase
MSENYARNYIDLPFEAVLRQYRKRNFFEQLERYAHSRFLEIGCGADPFFKYMDDTELTVAVEPEELFFENIKLMADKRSDIVLYNDLIENLPEDLKMNSFNYIVIGGFLHEALNPHLVLQKVRNLCQSDTMVYSYVPNARSFHRLLAHKMGLIDDIYQKSGHDKLFDRQIVHDMETYNNLFTSNGFEVIDSGSYFVKPFTHKQMLALLKYKIIDDTCLDGLYKMTDLLPDMGAELWNICKVNDL